jgi:hypothetical protein
MFTCGRGTLYLLGRGEGTCASKYLHVLGVFTGYGEWGDKRHKGWEPMFLIRDFGLSEELSTKVGFAFSNSGLKSQGL